MGKQRSLAIGLVIVGLVVAACGPTPQVGSFTSTGSMITGRDSQTATLLQDGRVLMVGGQDSSDNYLASAELYDPNTGTFSRTGSMATARIYHTATLLPDGRVLVTGGLGDAAIGQLSEAELYDPKSGTFSLTGSMTTARSGQTATLLPGGLVLIAGGVQGRNSDTGNLASAELYNPKSGTFTPTGSMTSARSGQTATLLRDGLVVIVGGTSNRGDSRGVASAELYDPGTGTFGATGSMTMARTGHTATLLPGGQVLIMGGVDASAELYDVKSGTFTATGSMRDSGASSAVLLPDGRVFVLLNPNGEPELYDPGSGHFTDSGLALHRWPCTATLLPDGRVLIAGGMGEDGARADLYQP